MFDATITTLMATAIGTALVHTLIPDHWLPFVLIGRARSWSAGRTAALSGLSATIHVLLSILLAGSALLAGLAAAEALGQTLERAASVALVLFGVLYALWAWRKGGHFHPGGALLHRRGGEGDCSGENCGSEDEHLHYHADGPWIRDAGGFWLALIVGANPCVLVLPILLATARQGWLAFWFVAVAYAVPTLLLMTVLSALGVLGSRRVRLPLAARHMEAWSGLLVAAVALAVLWFEG